jgi:hypothetical protein
MSSTLKRNNHNKKKRTDIENIREGMLESELQQFSLVALKKYCKQTSLDTSGDMDELVSRIFRHLILSEKTKENVTANLHSDNTAAQPRKRKKGVKFADTESGSAEDSVVASVHYFSKSDPPARNFYDVLNAIDGDEEVPSKRQHRIGEHVSPLKFTSNDLLFQGFTIFDESLPLEKVVRDTGTHRHTHTHTPTLPLIKEDKFNVREY